MIKKHEKKLTKSTAKKQTAKKHVAKKSAIKQNNKSSEKMSYENKIFLMTNSFFNKISEVNSKFQKNSVYAKVYEACCQTISFFVSKGITDITKLKLPSNKFKAAMGIVERYEKIPAALIIVFVILGFLAWSLFASIEQFTMAQGRTIPRGKTIIIQHLEGGVIDDVLVREGQKVKKDDILFRISLSANQRSQEELEVDVAKLLIKKVRLTAEIEQIEPVFPDELLQNYPDIVNAELENYASRQETLENEKLIIDQQIIQSQKRISELNASLKSQKASLALNKERLDAQENLLAEGLVSNFEYLTTKSRVQDSIGRIAELTESIPAAKSKLEETKIKRANIQNAIKQDASQTLSDVETEIQRQQIVLERFTKQDFRKIIKSPSNGIIKQLLYQTAGGVVSPGEALVEIVPDTAKLIFEVQLPTSERGKVNVNQDALLKVTAYDFFKYGGLDGKVESISADAFVSENGSAYYRVTLTADKTYFGENPGEFPIEPGMEVIADIKTGKRKVIEYILVPVLKLKHNAFRQ